MILTYLYLYRVFTNVGHFIVAAESFDEARSIAEEWKPVGSFTDIKRIKPVKSKNEHVKYLARKA